MENDGSGLVGLPSSRDYSPAMNAAVSGVIPTDSRNLIRSNTTWAITDQDPKYWTSSESKDTNFTDDSSFDGDPFIRQVQQIMANNPISFPYFGSQDGKMSDHLRNVLIQFGWALKKKFPNKEFKPIISGNSINRESLTEAFKALNIALKPSIKEQVKDKDDKERIDRSEEEIIKSFQLFFSKSQPIIGQLYNGEIDGEINSQLITAAQATEVAIANAIGNKEVFGALWNSGVKRFNTSTSDLETALNLIQKQKGKENIAFLDEKGRKLALSILSNY